MDFNAINDRIS